VDEAHCVDQWGQDFRPEYGRLQEVRERLGSPPVLAFTATAGKEVQERILASLGIPDAEVFVRDVDRPNIAMLRWECPPKHRGRVIAALLAMPELNGQKAMVFVPSVPVGDELRQTLQTMGVDVPFYHSRLGTQWQRQELVKRFLAQSLPSVDRIICTNAFGMGLDVPNVRLVIHWQQSASTEDMLQEFGRAGRDGKPSVSVIFHDGRAGSDSSRLKFMAGKTVETSPLSQEERARMLARRTRQIDQVSTMLRSQHCFRGAVRQYFGDTADTSRRVLSERLLNWIFGSVSVKASLNVCCDHCDTKMIAKGGQLAYAAWALGEGLSRQRRR
jgi:superfamily II DNA helicase RecQ